MTLLSEHGKRRARANRRHPSLDALPALLRRRLSLALPLLRLPYFWDEAGYYIPAAWDFFRTGTLIPQTTVTNAHPPLPSILLAAWWHLSGYVVSGTRTLVCMVTAAALLGVFKLARNLTTTTVAAVTVVLTAVYPIWFAQSTLAHADIFAAAFTLWGLAFYLDRAEPASNRNTFLAALMFSLAALSKETAIVTPAALALWETTLHLRNRSRDPVQSPHLKWFIALLTPILPLIAWYAYHYRKTGFVFGNPEFLRYNATANLDAYRIALCLWHRLLHLTMHMNMFVPVVCAIAVLFIPVSTDAPRSIPKPQLKAIAVILLANWIAFSILGGALLTRYLLPMYPLILLVCVATWHRHLRQWWALAALSAAAFLAGIWINPPYAFAPEDNLTYRDMIVLHQRAVHFIDRATHRPLSSPHGPPPPNSADPNSATPITLSKPQPSRTFQQRRFRKPQPIPGATTSPWSFRPNGNHQPTASTLAAKTNPRTHGTSTSTAISPQAR